VPLRCRRLDCRGNIVLASTHNWLEGAFWEGPTCPSVGMSCTTRRRARTRNLPPDEIASAQCELMEQETVGGKPLNAITYGTLTGHLTRTLNALGLKREPIDVTPDLHEYLDTLQAPEPPDLVAVASADEGEN
jgi:hypothetical protein